MELNLAELRARGAHKFPGRPYIEDRVAAGEPLFETENGKIHLYSKKLKELGFDPLPRYTPVEDPPKGFFRLIYGRAPVHSFARTENNEMLHGLMPENEVWLATQVAQALGLKDGEKVVLENADGTKSLPIRLKVTEGIRSDCAYVVHGFGQRSRLLTRAGGRGASDSDLMSRVKVDPLMGGTGMRVNFVRPLALANQN
jgi:thiosulfate reductase/polysulfide reductase chain A